MVFDQLNREQKKELKQSMLMEKEDSVSWGDLADADKLITDEELRKRYGDTVFSPDDFQCTANGYDSIPM